MPRPKGLPKTGGRTKGTKNRTTLAREERIARSGLTPLDYMLAVMRDTAEPTAHRDWAAEHAAPYIHPKLAAMTVDTSLSGELVIRWQSESE